MTAYSPVLALSLSVLLLTGCRNKDDCCAPCVTKYTIPYVVEYQWQECCPEKCCEEMCAWNCEDACVEEEAPLEPIIFNEVSHSPEFLEQLQELQYQAIAEEYRVAVGDILEISVFDDQETLVGNVTVAPDGKIYYLFLEGIDARGKTIPELRNDVSDQLADLFLDPTVSIIPMVMTQNTFTVLGRVVSPGIYPLEQQVTARQAIGLAGGLLTDAPGSENGAVYINQANPGQNDLSSLRDSFLIRDGERVPIDFEQLVFSGDMTQDIPLQAGDYLYIASNDKRDIYVLGEGIAPGAVPFADGMSLMGALAGAGGWDGYGAYGADASNILVIRGSLEKPQVLRANAKAIMMGYGRDVYLQPGDIIYVHGKPCPFIRELVETAIYTFISSFGNTAGSHFGSRHIIR